MQRVATMAFLMTAVFLSTQHIGLVWALESRQPLFSQSSAMSAETASHTSTELTTVAPPASEDISDAQYFLGIRGLTVSKVPGDHDDVNVQHALQRGDRVVSDLVFFEPDHNTRSKTSSAQAMVDKQDISVVAALRLKF